MAKQTHNANVNIKQGMILNDTDVILRIAK